MTVETYTPNKTTTLETPVKILEDSPIHKTNGTKIGFVSLGCPKNLVDSERILTQLRTEGYDVVPTYNDSDLVIVNTCGFIDNAKEESVNTILRYAEAKKDGQVDKLYVTGCLSERYKDGLEDEIKEVDAFFGTRELPKLLKTLKADYKHELIGERIITTPSHYAFLKISEGCDRKCAFCAIPLMRGKHISTKIEGFYHDSPLYVNLNDPGCDCTSKRRIDLRKLIGNTMLCIEVDENQHKGYCKIDEDKRYNNLIMDFTGKYIFIRFNPDKYIDTDGKKRNPLLRNRLPFLLKEIKNQISRINSDKNKDLLEIYHMYYNENYISSKLS